ncbi:hypothetical protein Scep_009874 [Stephania cephalantha]|uniref:Uncharacterized protein n=1 Tax=Stephania cephalantha TaxID=152367 RepID=A0AAP0JVD8_9MAGN
MNPRDSLTSTRGLTHHSIPLPFRPSYLSSSGHSGHHDSPLVEHASHSPSSSPSFHSIHHYCWTHMTYRLIVAGPSIYGGSRGINAYTPGD